MIYLQLIRFLPNDILQNINHVTIVPGRWCRSNVGNLFKAGDSPGGQALELNFDDDSGSQACGSSGFSQHGYGIVIHELCHILGTFSIHQILKPIRRFQVI